jgi:hypothetical protein
MMEGGEDERKGLTNILVIPSGPTDASNPTLT